MCSRVAVAGAIVRLNMVLRRRSIIALCVGLSAGFGRTLFRHLAGNGRSADTQMIDSTHVKAHRSAAGAKGGSRNRLLAARAAGETRRFMHSQMLKDASLP